MLERLGDDFLSGSCSMQLTAAEVVLELSNFRACVWSVVTSTLLSLVETDSFSSDWLHFDCSRLLKHYFTLVTT